MNSGTRLAGSGGLAGGGTLRNALFLSVSVGLAGCFNGGGDGGSARCPNMPIADGVIGQAGFNAGASNAGGIGARTLSGPFGSIATNGSLTYLADTANNRVLGYLAPPTGVGTPASFELGQGDGSGTDFTGNAPGVGSTSLSAPSKVSVSNDDRLVVTDTGNNRVLVWNTLPTANTAPDLVVGQPDFNSFHANQRQSAPTAATLNAPTAAVIANGALIVADRGNHRVLIWNSVPTAPNTPADVELGQAATRTTDGTTTSCTANTGTDGFCFTTAVAAGDTAASGANPPVPGLSAPSDLWTDGYKLLLSDSGNHRVLFWSQLPFANNTLYTHVIGQSGPAENTAGTGNQRLNTPWGVVSDGAAVVVADAGNNRVLAFSAFPVQHGYAAYGVFGQADFDHVAANDRDQDGVAGTHGSLDPAFNTLNFPTGVHVTASGNLYVADRGNHRVLKFPLASAVNGTVPSSCNGTNPEIE